MKNTSYQSPYKLIEHWDGYVPTFPLHLEIHPSNRCNHRCKRCAAVIPKIPGAKRYEDAQKRLGEWNVDKMLDFLEDAISCGVKAITFSGGGEPLFWPGMKKALKLLHNNGLDYGIITNLNVQNIGKEVIEYLQQATFVRVSLDAATEETYQELHNPKDGGGLSTALHNCARIVDGPCDLGITFLVQEENVSEIWASAELAKNLGANYVRFGPVHTNKQGKEYESVWDDMWSRINSARELEDDNFHVMASEKRFRNLMDAPNDFSDCWYHRLHCIVCADMTISFCCLLDGWRGSVLVDLKDYDTFTDAWVSEERKANSRKLDARKCPKGCWFRTQNEILNYLMLDGKKHVNFV